VKKNIDSEDRRGSRVSRRSNPQIVSRRGDCQQKNVAMRLAKKRGDLRKNKTKANDDSQKGAGNGQKDSFQKYKKGAVLDQSTKG